MILMPTNRGSLDAVRPGRPGAERVPSPRVRRHRIRCGDRLFCFTPITPYSDYFDDGHDGQGAAVVSAGEAALFNRSSSACTLAQSFGFRLVA